VAWETARRVGGLVAEGGVFGGGRALDERAWDRLREDFGWATEEAEALVVAETGLVPAEGPSRGEVLDRRAWVAQNLATFERLLTPVLERWPQRQLPGPLGAVQPELAGAELGLVLGWMARRVLGQYDLLVAERPGADPVSYVGPNVAGLEARFGFPPRRFRLWIALHEVTHRCQFTGVPWLRSYFLDLVEQVLAEARPDPAKLLEALGRAAQAVRRGENPLAEAGVVGLVASKAQRDLLRRIQALMALLEGHGDVTMNRAAAERLPEAGWFAQVLEERRQRGNPLSRLLLQLTGLGAKLAQYRKGERFIEEVERAGGRELLARVWEGPALLPSWEEIEDPSAWVARVGGA
jgi:coenzyme F420 biosynthesis associated uncharacterized protein